jgi:hypothetical protein
MAIAHCHPDLLGLMVPHSQGCDGRPQFRVCSVVRVLQCYLDGRSFSLLCPGRMGDPMSRFLSIDSSLCSWHELYLAMVVVSV